MPLVTLSKKFRQAISDENVFQRGLERLLCFCSFRWDIGKQCPKLKAQCVTFNVIYWYEMELCF